MKENVFLITLLFLIRSIYCGYEYSCDYQFGDPSWSYSKVFYNKSHIIPAGDKSYKIYLTETKLMVSFVCINICYIKPNHANVSYASLFKRISIDFDIANECDVTVHVLAMHHGYRRYEGTLWNGCITYVLVQVRKGENKSNGDTLIHKVVPSQKFDEIANTARKQFKNFKQYKIKSQPDDKELESIVFAIKTEANANGDRRQDGGGLKMAGNIVSKLINKFVDIFKRPDSDELPDYRAKLEKYNIKPEIIQFKNSNGKRSMMYEIDTKSILRTIRDVLSSKKFKMYTDNLVNKAAIIYRTFKEELEQE